MDNNSIKYLDRASGEIITETVMGDRALRFAYNTLLGRSLWAVFFGGKAVSALMGLGFTRNESAQAVKKAHDLGANSVEEIIMKALQGGV